MRGMPRLARAVAVGVASLLSVSVVSATPAQAAGTCSLVVPSKVRIASPYQAVTARLSSDCSVSNTAYASWEAYHPTQGWNDILVFDGQSSDIWGVYDWGVTPSRYTWRPSLAQDYDYNDVAQNQPTTDVRLGSGAAITTTRSGNYVTVKTSSSRYAYSLSKWVRWGGVRGLIQYYGPSGWTNLKYAYQDANGYFTYRLYAPKARSYRVVFPDADSIWGSISKSSYR